MVFTLYPNPPAAPLTVAAGARVDTGFGQLTGEPVPEFVGIYAGMMFLQLAVIGEPRAQNVFLRAGHGPPVPLTEVTQPVFRATTVGGAGTGYVGDVVLSSRQGLSGPGAVLQVRVGFAQATSETWTLGIQNSDSEGDRHFAWAVSDSEVDSSQPWAHPGSFVPAFAEPPAAPFTPDHGVEGKVVVLTGRNFHVGTPRVLFGTVPASLVAPPEPAVLSVAVPEGMVAAGRANSSVPITVSTNAGSITSDTTFRADSLAPRFARPPFTPTQQARGRVITLHGSNFDVDRVSVRFGLEVRPPFGRRAEVAGEIIGSPTPSKISVRIPARLPIPPGSITRDLYAAVIVTNRHGSAVARRALRIIARRI